MPLPYRLLRPEQRLLRDLHGIVVHQRDPGDEFHNLRTVHSAINHPYGGSNNWTNLGFAVRSFVGWPASWRWVREQYGRLGHDLAEFLSGNYGHLTHVSRAATLALWRDDPDLRQLVHRDLALFALLARPIEADFRGRPYYTGYAARTAGLRTLPHAWNVSADSYLQARLLGLKVWTDQRFKRAERELVEITGRIVAPLQRAAPTALTHCRDLAHSVIGTRATDWFKGVLEPVSTPHGMGAVLARHLPTNQTWSCLTGRRAGNNTAALWASWCEGPRDENTWRVYPWQDSKGRPLSRVRGGKLRRAGGMATGYYNERTMQYAVGRDDVAYGIDWRDEEFTIPPWLVNDPTKVVRLDVTDSGSKLTVRGEVV